MHPQRTAPFASETAVWYPFQMRSSVTVTLFTTIIMKAKNFLDVIRSNNEGIDHKRVRRALVIIDFDGFRIGDSVVFFSYLRALESYLENASIDLCTTTAHYSILKNNPIPSRLFFDFAAVDCTEYDLFLLFCNEEGKYLDPLADMYTRPESKGDFTACVFSLVSFTYIPPLLPFYKSFLNYQMDEYNQTRSVIGQEVFVSQEEKAWATDFLREKGVKEDEKVIVLLDGASQEKKLLEPTVFFEVVNYFRTFSKVKILIFDENNIGKEALFRNALNDDALEDFIFVKQQPLRQAICLLSTDYIALIFGPCTGLLHCASGIYNSFVQAGMPMEDIPAMITYSGHDPDLNEWEWWGESWVDCIYLEEDPQEGVQIKRLTGREYQSLPCTEYTGPLLINYLNKHYGHKLLVLQPRLIE